MSIKEQIREFIAGHKEPKRGEMQALHDLILKVEPKCRLWFLDGKDENGKIVSNPNIGYGAYTIRYADGKTKEFFQIGLSSNKTGISVYIMGLEDKKYLAERYGSALGEAAVTGYCIKFKTLKDIDLGTLERAIRDRFEASV